MDAKADFPLCTTAKVQVIEKTQPTDDYDKLREIFGLSLNSQLTKGEIETIRTTTVEDCRQGNVRCVAALVQLLTNRLPIVLR